MPKVLLDTDVIINLLKKKEETISKISSLQKCEFYISPIVVAEVYAGAGARAKEIAQIEALLSFFETVTISHKIGLLTGEYANKFKKPLMGFHSKTS